MDSHVGGHEGQAISQLEAAVLQGLAFADACQAQGRFMDQLQGQPGFDAGAGLPRPAAEKIPGSEPEVLGNEEPQANQIACDAVGQGLADAVFQRRRVARTLASLASGGVGLDRGGSARTAFIEFFFAGRTRR